LLRQNDIVTPAVTSLENIGKMARIESDMPTTTVGGFVFILRPYLNDDILSEYLLSVMSAPATVEFMRSITNKSGQAFYNIGKERLSTTLIPVPPHKEQRLLIKRIQHLFSKLRQLAEQARNGF
jgi:type I restriction enzyme S subunit